MTVLRITYRNPESHVTLPVYFNVLDNALTPDWLAALEQLLVHNTYTLEKNFMLMGYVSSERNLEFLCNEMNQAILTINQFNETETWLNAGLSPYTIEEYACPDAVMFGAEYLLQDIYNSSHCINKKNCLRYNIKSTFTNKIHQHFERLQGTVEHPSRYFDLATADVKYAIRQLNVLVHEIESYVRALRKRHTRPEELQMSNIIVFPHSPRYKLKDAHRQLFAENGYNRDFGRIYAHWAQIGKTLYEVYCDEGAPPIEVGDDPRSILVYNVGHTGATCEAITALDYYSGEFDVVWGETSKRAFVVEELAEYKQWLKSAGVEWDPVKYSLGYLPLADCDFDASFGTRDRETVQQLLTDYADIYEIAIEYPTHTVSRTFDACWSDADWHTNLKTQLYGEDSA